MATLARLALDDARLEACRDELAAILEHVATLESLDVEGVEPMAHPTDVTNRLADDEPVPGMPVADLLANAPAVEQQFISVPKVLDEGGG